jgi:membrane-anchored protein YejM (alkaline phosphatase superfamily)
MEPTNLAEKNVVFITLDSCRYDTADRASIPTIQSIGPVRKAHTHGSYTVPAHAAFFSGHLPTVLHNPTSPFYSESSAQLWRIKTGHYRDHRPTGILLDGNNILDGYRQLGHYVLGVGGVSQFADGSFLRSYFGDEFIFYGIGVDEEPLTSRLKGHFPLNHIDEIVRKLANRDKWFLFLNCPETHYPYDVGEGIKEEVLGQFPTLEKVLNQRESAYLALGEDFSAALKDMQKKALEVVDHKLNDLLHALPKDRDILVVICGDHGENFGEYFVDKPRWGHLFPSPEVMAVPLTIGELNG